MYTQQNLEKLLNECYNEIEQKFKDTYYANYFNFKKDRITIKSGHTTGRVLGRCNYYGVSYTYDYWGRRRTIKDISSFVITIYDHENRDIKGIKETIIHELIHTLKGCQNHKSEFKYYCSVIKNHLGYSCLSGQQDDIKQAEYRLNFKHFLVCSKCNKATRVGVVKEGKEKIRVCKKCGAKIK
jgi:hypothetical protein